MTSKRNPLTRAIRSRIEPSRERGQPAAIPPPRLPDDERVVVDAKRAAAALVGKTIRAIEFHPFDDGRGGLAFDPHIVFDDARLCFIVTETETGAYGIKLVYVRRA